jgi:hypothetical protein
MTQQTGSEQAAAALEEIDQRQRQVIDQALVPRWFWWMVGVGMVAVGAVADTGQTRYIVAAAFTYALLVAAVSVWFIAGRARARVHSELLGAQAAVAILAFVYVVVGLSLAVAFRLKAGHVAHPGTFGTLVGAVLVIAGGPMLMSVLRRIMLAKRATSMR